MNRDNRVNAYIEKAQPFAQEILTELRKRVHDNCPQVQETMKWSFPNFMYKGKILCSMAAFKSHCSFGFWLASIMKSYEAKEKEGMGDFGKMKSLKDLPEMDIFKSMLFEAMELIDAGKSLPKPLKVSNSSLQESEDLLMELKKHPQAQLTYERFSNSHRKEYNQWILEAKTESTRNKRIEQAIEWLSEGKSRNWKYEKC